MAYVISEVGFDHPKRFDSLASALRVAAKMVAKNERDGESNYIYIRDTETPANQASTIVSIHAEGRTAKAHRVAMLARVSEAMARENCYACDGDGFSGDPLGGNCPRCGGGGKELR